MIDDVTIPSLTPAGQQSPPWTPPAEGGMSPPAPFVDRRRQPRFAGQSNLLWVLWWDNAEYLGRSARLVNVSREGAMIVAAAALRPKQSVRLYLEEPEPQPGIGASVLDVVEGRLGMNQIRLRFHSPCPDTMIRAAAIGFESWLAGVRVRV